MYIVVSVPPSISQSEDSSIASDDVFDAQTSGSLDSTEPKIDYSEDECAEDLMFRASDGEKGLEEGYKIDGSANAVYAKLRMGPDDCIEIIHLLDVAVDTAI